MERLILLICLFGLTACSTLQRSSQSGMTRRTDTNAGSRYFEEKRSHDYNSAAGEMGIDSTRALNESEHMAVRTRLELKRLEALLHYSEERKQYYTYKPFLKNDLHRIYFLNLPSMEARERWANAQGIVPDPKTFAPGVIKMIEANDVSVGMSRNAVRESWGDPDTVEVAGNTIYGNERWKYFKMISTNEGYSQEVRVIYFESGRVVGWEKL